MSGTDTLSDDEMRFLCALNAYQKALESPGGASDADAQRLLSASEQVDGDWHEAARQALVLMEPRRGVD